MRRAALSIANKVRLMLILGSVMTIRHAISISTNTILPYAAIRIKRSNIPCPKEARALFVERLRSILTDKDIVGCLPRHHASLINDAVSNNWTNYWDGNIFSMMKRAGALARQYT